MRTGFPAIVAFLGIVSLSGCARNGASPAAGQKTPPKPSFEALVKDAKVQAGFFTFHRKKDDLFWEIPADRLEKNFILKMSVEEGFGLPAALTGQPLGGIDIAAFEKIDEERVRLVSRNVEYVAEAGSPLERAVDRAFPDSVLATLKVEAVHPKTKNLLVNMKPLLLSDAGFVERINRAAGKETPYAFDAGGSYVKEAKAFPENIEILSSLHFTSKKPGPFGTVPDARSLSVGINYSFSMLPENSSYRPRAYDDRVGFFRATVRDFAANDPLSPDRHSIMRWNLEKQDPAAGKSPPKRPIRFWIDNATPREYREAVRRGILAWNAAFEAIGFVGAVEAHQMPDDADWDPSDVRYSVVRWITARECPFGGLGPARMNPATGEILDADILINGEIARTIRNRYRMGVAPVREGSVEKPGMFGCCDLAERLSGEAAFALDVLSARGDLSPLDPAPPEFVEAYIQDVVCHEVGHVLGLRHNFRGSLLTPFEKIHDKEWTGKHGLSGSVMEYDPINIASKGKPQGFYFSPGVGPCDVWTIAYGYSVFHGKTPEEETVELRKIAGRCGEPAHAFATDEDADQSDPTVARFDFSGDPLAFCRQQFEVAREVMASAETFHKEGRSYSDFRDLVGRYLGVYRGALPIVVRHVGGQRILRIHAGDMPGVMPVAPTPPERSREALRILAGEIFSDTPFRFSPELLAKLTPDRMNREEDLDYFVHPRVGILRKEAIDLLTRGDLLRRVQESSLRVAAAEKEKPLDLAELFGWMTETLWTELDAAPAPVSPARRDAQWLHLERLGVILAGAGKPGREPEMPEEARSLAWMQLDRLAVKIGAVLAGPGKPFPDPATQAHLARARARIAGILAAYAEGE